MESLARKHWLLIVLVVAAAIAAVLIDETTRNERAAPARSHAQVKKNTPVARESVTPGGSPKVDLERLAQRTSRAQSGDPFQSRGWTEPRERPREPVVEVEAQQAPPLPFEYLGRWTEGDQVVVVLGREGRSYLARAGEVIDGTYRVDSIEPARVGLTYLPLNVRQSLGFERAPVTALGKATVPTLAKGDAAEVALRVAMPAQASLAEEFTILLSLDPRQTALVERGSVELIYDPKILNVTVAGTTRLSPSASRPDPGRVQVEMGGAHIGHGGASTAIRLRVVANAPTTTQIRLAALEASDAEDRNLQVAVDGPNPQTLTIVQGSKTK